MIICQGEKMIYISLDDTDTEESRGTGHLARHIAGTLGKRYNVWGVTRHQLFQSPQIPYTRQNSANVIHLADERLSLQELAEQVQDMILADFQPGSDPGLCVAQHTPPQVLAYARRAQREVVTMAEALALARQYDIILRGLGGDESGVIGAICGVALAASGEDGRFCELGAIRDLQGVVPIATILASGVTEVCNTEGQVITNGEVETGGKVRPALVGGRPVLFVEWNGSRWRAVRRG
jgi:hypothetical protein